MLRRLLPWLALGAAAFAPAIFALWLVANYGVNVPVGDQWSISTMFGRGWVLPPFAELMSQANESRPFFPKLVFTALARLGSWDVRREMWLTQVTLWLTAAGYAYLWYRTMPSRRLALWWPVALMSLLVFSPTQHDNYFWGIQWIVYVPFACLMAVLVTAAQGASVPVLLVVSAVAGTIATFSYANGMLVWALSAPLIVFTHPEESRARWRWWLVWAGAWSVCGWLYFRDLSAGAVPSTAAVAGTPADAARALLAFIGSCLATGSSIGASSREFAAAVAAGLVTLAVVAIAGGYLALRPRLPGAVHPLTVWGTVIAYGVISGVLTVFGRLRFGPEYMLASRYVAFSNPVIIATLFLIVAAAFDAARLAGARGRRVATLAAAASALVLAALSVRATREALPIIRDVHRLRMQARAVLTYFDVARADELHLLVGWSDTIVTTRAPILLAAGVLLDPRPDTRFVPSTDRRRGCVDAASTAPDAESPATGWAFLAHANRPADAVLVTRADAASKVVAIAVPTKSRPDAVELLGTPAAFVTGWDLERPPQGARFWAYDAATNQAFALAACPRR